MTLATIEEAVAEIREGLRRAPDWPAARFAPRELYGAHPGRFDVHLAELRKAAAVWESRRGPKRRVVDVVCLVPDLPGFLQAIATWDQEHYFPILLDDAEYAPKFLRAFRPARVVRFPRKAEAIPADRLWEEAAAAVGKACSSCHDNYRVKKTS